MFSPSVRRSLVTGASQPLGIELVRQCLRRGDRVIACARNPARVPVLADMRAEFGGLELVALDPPDAAAVADAIPVIQRITESIDLLVIAPAEPAAHERSGDHERDEHFDTLSGTGLLERVRRQAVAPLLLVRTLLPLLAAAEDPRILVVGDSRGSVSTKTEGGGYATSVASAALHMLMRTLAHDLSEQGIAVCIGNGGNYRSEDDASFSIPIDEAAIGLLAVADRVPAEGSGMLIDWTGAERGW